MEPGQTMLFGGGLCLVAGFLFGWVIRGVLADVVEEQLWVAADGRPPFDWENEEGL